MNKKQEKKILSLRKKGLSIKKIAAETGVGEHSVSKFLKAAHETKAEENAKTKGPIIGKYVKIADPKSVNGTDSVRIRFKGKDADKAMKSKCQNCKLEKELAEKDIADKSVCDDSDDLKFLCSVNIDIKVPDVISEEDEGLIRSAQHDVAVAFKEFLMNILDDYGFFEPDEDEDSDADED